MILAPSASTTSEPEPLGDSADEPVNSASHGNDGTSPAGDPRAADLPMGRGERVLLVDDEDTVRRVTGRLLEKLGYEVQTADDGIDALRILDDLGPFDLILTDVVMPRMTGIEMAEQIRDRTPDQKILFTSGYTTRQYGRAPGEPPKPFMPKPFSLADLAESVRRTLDA